ncbi:Tryptophan--tRNA ligase, mitochondrial [Mycoemilia scoparia]|uniref:Tryptophan--tRNA ligase, mitochondrial n=1 Tax=Mycoemilia scoparia TaxID=417184 RepID=A0A9W8DRJ4_9FUNG|nr:Tryptophan--tRNA ligase, mitochondrial [Mycoemilia scoparia]
MATKITRIFSGIQPTGIPHLGNYLGTLSNWARLQDQLTRQTPSEDCATNAVQARDKVIYSIADLHAFTVPQPPKAVLKNTLDMTASIIACGVDPERCVLFRQSAVPLHTELAWMLNCITPVGWLHKMTQWKTKLQNKNPSDHGTASSGIDAASDPNSETSKLRLGLFAYPVLQAADILLYSASHVPVGEDQKQHIELTRDIADMANRHFKTKLFQLPDVLMTTNKRVMSLRDPTKKMSKSDKTANATILLTDSDDDIRSKIRKTVTDPIDTVTYDPENRPGVANLLRIYSAFYQRAENSSNAESSALNDVTQLFAGKKNQELKEKTTDIVIESTRKVRQELKRIIKEEDYLMGCLLRGEEEASMIAAKNWERVKKASGLS